MHVRPTSGARRSCVDAILPMCAQSAPQRRGDMSGDVTQLRGAEGGGDERDLLVGQTLSRSCVAMAKGSVSKPRWPESIAPRKT